MSVMNLKVVLFATLATILIVEHCTRKAAPEWPRPSQALNYVAESSIDGFHKIGTIVGHVSNRGLYAIGTVTGRIMYRVRDNLFELCRTVSDLLSPIWKCFWSPAHFWVGLRTALSGFGMFIVFVIGGAVLGLCIYLRHGPVIPEWIWVIYYIIYSFVTYIGVLIYAHKVGCFDC